MGKEEEDAEQHANNRTIKGDVPSIFSSTKPKAITEAFLFLLIDHALSSHRRASSNLFPNELEPFQHFLLSWPPFCLSLRSSGNICEKRYKKSSATSKRKENSLHGHLDNSTRKISTQKLPNRPTRHCFFAKVENFTRLLKTCPQRHKSRDVYITRCYQIVIHNSHITTIGKIIQFPHNVRLLSIHAVFTYMKEICLSSEIDSARQIYTWELKGRNKIIVIYWTTFITT